MTRDPNSVPDIAIGNDELGATLGDTIVCPVCGARHPIEHGTNPVTGQPSDLLQFYRCGGTSYLAGIGGRAIPPRRNAT